MMHKTNANGHTTCPSQLFVLSEIIDKFVCACQAVIMMKMLGNLVLFIWLKLKVSLNLAVENLALRQQLAVMKRTNKRPKNSNGGSALLGSAFPNLDSLAQISHHFKAGYCCLLAS